MGRQSMGLPLRRQETIIFGWSAESLGERKLEEIAEVVVKNESQCSK
jgi:hypothetical protein